LAKLSDGKCFLLDLSILPLMNNGYLFFLVISVFFLWVVNLNQKSECIYSINKRRGLYFKSHSSKCCILIPVAFLLLFLAPFY
jgi:hypothetical protein